MQNVCIICVLLLMYSEHVFVLDYSSKNMLIQHSMRYAYVQPEARSYLILNPKLIMSFGIRNNIGIPSGKIQSPQCFPLITYLPPGVTYTWFLCMIWKIILPFPLPVRKHTHPIHFVLLFLFHPLCYRALPWSFSTFLLSVIVV